MKTIIVVPTNRPERIEQFIIEWGQAGLFQDDTTLLVIEDNSNPTIKTTSLGHYLNIFHYSHKNIDADLGDKGNCIARFAPAVRSYGIWKAAHWEPKPDMIWTTDDDCLPCGHDPIGEHWAMLETPRILHWWRNAPHYLRGFPYEIRDGVKPMLNHGLVEGVPDIDAPTQLLNPHLTHAASDENEHIPKGVFFPMSIQNVAFRPEIAPLMYLPILPEGMKRWSDIWCGLVMKRICDERDWPVSNGFPCVRHERASNVWNNLKEEWAGLKLNERLWQVIRDAQVGSDDLLDDYLHIAYRIHREFPELKVMTEGMMQWAELWRDDG